MKRKIISLLLLIGACFALVGCTQSKELAGSEKVEALRNQAANYNSGRYFITNVDTDVLEQVFTFMYESEDKKSPQLYLCEGVENGEYYSEYSNGIELFREENGVGAVVPSADETYAAYTRKDPHPYSTGQLFFYVKGYIDTAEETSDADGNTVYIYNYDVERINKALGNNLTAFATSYAFDSDGNFVYFRQHNSSDITDENGGMSTQSFTYEITIEEINNISELENPVIIGGSAVE